jgi:hypothetical protein
MDSPRIEFEPNDPLIVNGPARIVDADGLEKKVAGSPNTERYMP